MEAVALFINAQKIPQVDFKLVVAVFPYILHEILIIFYINVRHKTPAVLHIHPGIQDTHTVSDVALTLHHAHDKIAEKAFLKQGNRLLHPLLVRPGFPQLFPGLVQFPFNLPECFLQLVHICRLQQVVLRAVLQSLYRQFKLLITADKHYTTGKMMLENIFCHIQPGHMIHLDICQNDIRYHIIQILNHILSVRKQFRHLESKAFPVHNVVKPLPNPLFIIRDDKPVHICHLFTNYFPLFCRFVRTVSMNTASVLRLISFFRLLKSPPHAENGK